MLTTESCRRIDGTLDDGLGTAPDVVFHIEDTAGVPELQIAFDGPTATVEDASGGALDTISTGALGSSRAPDAGPVAFSLVIGRRAAALVIDDHIVGAVALPARPKITLEPTQSLTVDDLRIGAPPPGSGC